MQVHRGRINRTSPYIGTVTREGTQRAYKQNDTYFGISALGAGRKRLKAKEGG